MFAITYETVTPESAEHGDAAEHGWIINGQGSRVTLGDCFWALRNAGAIGCHVEASEYPVREPRWLTFYKVNEDYATGAETSWSLHFPETATAATRRRIARLFGCYGV